MVTLQTKLLSWHVRSLSEGATQSAWARRYHPLGRPSCPVSRVRAWLDEAAARQCLCGYPIAKLSPHESLEIYH
ncbi:hypothetical protein E2C01_047684 [Portunus trituberculatus]|uniref:Uncharacterized protein n=1 Tax=Portunus trituberculatus TaxID=210409 RepID=A0A5B7GB72_PORTR|nr:hypothetical protein [Portunus trituberculatus]